MEKEQDRQTEDMQKWFVGIAQPLHVKLTHFCPRSLISPTCVWWSCPDLFGESVGTSEALIECLEREEAAVDMLFILSEYNNTDIRWNHHQQASVWETF